jgi:uncharacterized protein (DUF362 family)/NAD-dependent dihydropyrimidine dehydrogenase PreA subunit
MSRVAVIKCDDYDEDGVAAAVERGIGLLGGISSFVKPGERILLKPNLLAPEVPEACVTTHPAVFRAVAMALEKGGAELFYGDSPAMGNMAAAAERCGIAAVARGLSIEAADFREGVNVHYPRGRQNRHFVLAKGVLEADGIVSIPKLKTHAFEKYTGAVKNQFGCVPGFLKGEFHVKVPDADSFALMLLDLNALVHPRLYVMDGIMAMEGNGPRGGRPVKLGVLLLSDDPVALDSVACRIIAVDPMLVPTVRLGQELGYGEAGAGSVELCGDDISMLVSPSFDIDRKRLRPIRTRGIMRFFRNRLVPKPFINPDRCLRSGSCGRMWPAEPKAVDWIRGNKKKPPVYDYRRCIRCYCCQEVCPEKAIRLKKPLLRRLFPR